MLINHANVVQTAQGMQFRPAHVIQQHLEQILCLSIKKCLGYKYSIHIMQYNTRLRYQQYRSETEKSTLVSAIMYKLSCTSRHRASQRLANHISLQHTCNCNEKVMYKCPQFTGPSSSGSIIIQLAAAMCSSSKCKCQSG